MSREDRDDLLTRLLIRYDEFLAGTTSRQPADELDVADDSTLSADLAAAKHCLEMLARARRSDAAPCDKPEPGSPFAAEAPRQLGRFSILRELGRGGLGIVYLAHDPKLGRAVALKVPRFDAASTNETRRRFLREAEAAARLSHPNLVTLHDVSEDGEFLASEYCDGPTLTEWLRARSQPLPVRQAAALVLELAEGVEHAHSRGVLHRDIKPSNVILVSRAADASSPLTQEGLALLPKLTDFGMAKLLEQSGETRSGMILGTLSYMAPEQADGRNELVDARADVYGLGAVLYELLTGAAPHTGSSDVDTLRRLIAGEPPPVRYKRFDVPRDLEAITGKCLAHRATDRYATAHELAGDLRRFLSHQPTLARPLRYWELAWRWAGRKPLAAALVAVSCLAILLLFGVVVGYNARLQREVARADESRAIAEHESAASGRMLYAADVRLAEQALRGNNVPQALSLLERHRPRPGYEDLREFTWHLLREQSQPPTLQLVGHQAAVKAVAFSPDGIQLATAAEDGTVRLWNGNSGKQEHLLRDEAREFDCLAYSPNGTYLATGGIDSKVLLWNVRTGILVRRFEGHTDHVLSVAFSPDGDSLASGSRDKSVRVWNAATGASIMRQEKDLDVIRAVSYSPDGKFLYGADEVGRIHAWRCSDQAQVEAAQIRRKQFFAMAIAHSGRWIASGGSGSLIHLWSPLGELPLDGQLRVAGELESRHRGWLQSLAISPNDEILASGSNDGVVQLWRLGEAQPFRTLPGHTERVWSVAWSPDGKRLASAGTDGVRVSLLDEPEVMEPQVIPLPVSVHSAAFSPCSGELICVDSVGTLRAWEASGHQRLEIPGISARTTLMRISDDGDFIAALGNDKQLRVRRLDSLLELFAAKVPTGNEVLAWQPGSRRLAASLHPNLASIVNVDTGNTEYRFDHGSELRGAAFTPDGKTLVTTSGQALKVWDVSSGREQYSRNGSYSELLVSPDGRFVVTCSLGEVVVIDLRRAFEVSKCVIVGLDAHCLAMHETTLAVGIRQPPTVSLWDARTRQELLRLECPGARLEFVAFSPNGNRLAAGGTDINDEGRIWQWRVHREKQ